MQNPCQNTTYGDTHQFNVNVLTYLQLDVMATWLLNETIDLSQEYNTKIQHVLEQQKIVNENENELVKLHEALEKLQVISCEMEHEIQNIDNILDVCDKGKEKLKTTDCPKCTNSKITTLNKLITPPTQQEQFLKLLEQADRAIQNARNIALEMQEIRDNKRSYSNPYKIIFQILNYHCEALNHTEKNLDLIMDKMGFIDQLYRNITCNTSKTFKDASN